MNSSGLAGGGSLALRAYPARWKMLCIYCCLGLFNQAMWLSFAPAPKATALRYNVPEGAIAAIAYSNTALYLPGSWICGTLLAKSGLRRAIVTACALQAIGAVIRCLADIIVRPVSAQAGFVILFLGQGLGALATPAFMNTPAVIAEAWFKDTERDSAVAAGTLCPVFGQGVGSAIAGFVVWGSRGEGTSELLIGQGIATLLFSIWAACAFRDRPPTPPSRIAEVALARSLDSRGTQASTLATWAKLLCRPQFMLLFLIFNSGLAVAAAVLTLYGRFAEKCGYGSSVAGAASGLYMLGAVVGAVVIGAVLGATRAYIKALRITVACAVTLGFIFTASLRPGGLVQLLIATAVFGAFMMSVLPVLIGAATEETFPAPAEASTGLLQISAIALQVVFTPIEQEMINLDGNTCGGMMSPSRVFIMSVAVLGCLVPALAYRGKLNRMLAEAACTADSAAAC